MKQLFTLFFSVLVSVSAFAGQGGPDTWGYTWKDSNEPGGPVYSWIDIVSEGGTEVKLLADDNSRGPFPMNFDFTYYWYDVNQFWVGSNGYLLFQNGNIASPFQWGASTLAPHHGVAAFWIQQGDACEVMAESSNKRHGLGWSGVALVWAACSLTGY